MSKRYAISDIHGCPMSLEHLMQRLHLQEGDHLYLLGDYIDRGPDSKSVLDFLMTSHHAKFDVTILRGNHEQLLLDSLTDQKTYDLWLRVGGKATLESFGVKHVQDIPQEYIDYLDSLPYHVDLPDYYLVHGGFNLALEDPFSDPWSMMNLRDFYVDDTFLQGRRIVRGHVPTMLSKIREEISNEKEYVITIDNGCVYAEVWGLGNLLAFNLNDQTLLVQPCVDVPSEA